AIDLMDEAAARTQMESYLQARKRRAAGTPQAAERDWETAKEEALLAGDMERVRALKKQQQAEKRKQERALARAQARPVVTEERVARVVSGWTRIPLQKLAEKETDRLRNLEKELHRRVVGQEEAVTAVARAVRRGRVRLTDSGRPIGSFLFLGPTGVGKTELAKALADAVFGRESAMIRIDMSEYMEKHSVSRLLGSPPGYVGYEEGGQLSEKVRRNPYSVILFDEIEKAHPDVFNILLQILDDGRVTDSQGRTVDFKNTILIMTSNAGAERIVQPKKLGFSAGNDAAGDHERMKSGVMEEVKRLFRPEFLNRIDETIVFHSLTKENMKEIFTILLKGINKGLSESHRLHISVNAAAREDLIRRGYDPKYGARPLRRVLQQEIEDGLADAYLAGDIQDGDEVKVTLVKGKIALRAAKR
ncbi:MAG: ATP-dependent Clp protease ATP-binding subunit, partial [Lachnospiraceae bacterium]|nr:ATP-dependent Clp protease ATP-binding subunit [Lachnospiraceae bacterium]